LAAHFPPEVGGLFFETVGYDLIPHSHASEKPLRDNKNREGGQPGADEDQLEAID
jgi:hypothetical protein